MGTPFTHIDRKGKNIHMVNIIEKTVTRRTAVARSLMMIGSELFEKLFRDETLRRSIFTTAKTAGILAAKKTGELIPLCHPLPIENNEIDINLHAHNQIRIQCTVSLDGKTGVEMEALTAASITALTVYDMCKSVDKTIRIVSTGLYKKTGGKSGDFLNSAMEWD